MKYFECDSENKRVIQPYPYHLATPLNSDEPMYQIVPKENHLHPFIEDFTLTMDATGYTTFSILDGIMTYSESITELGDYTFTFGENYYLGSITFTVNEIGEYSQTFRSHLLKNGFLVGEDTSADSIYPPEIEYIDSQVSSFAIYADASMGVMGLGQLSDGTVQDVPIWFEFAWGERNTDGRFSGDTTALEWDTEISAGESQTLMTSGEYQQIFVRTHFNIPMYGHYYGAVHVDLIDYNMNPRIDFINHSKIHYYSGEQLYILMVKCDGATEYEPLWPFTLPQESELSSIGPYTWDFCISKMNAIGEYGPNSDPIVLTYTPGEPLICNVDYPINVTFEDLGKNTRLTATFASQNHNAEYLVIDGFSSIDVRNKQSVSYLIEGEFEWDENYTLTLFTRALKFGESARHDYPLTNINHSVFNPLVATIQIRSVEASQNILQEYRIDNVTLFGGYRDLYIDLDIMGQEISIPIRADDYGIPTLELWSMSFENVESDLGDTTSAEDLEWVVDLVDDQVTEFALYGIWEGKRVWALNFLTASIQAQNFSQQVTSVPVLETFYAGSNNKWITLGKQVIFGWNETELKICRIKQEESYN